MAKVSSINSVADYIVYSFEQFGEAVTQMKLHKLLYYVQAWHLALKGEKAFDEDFLAWIHGPVSRTIYDRFKPEKGVYCPITIDDISFDFKKELPESLVYHIDAVLESYGQFSGTQLEELTHRELPWQEARTGLGRFEQSESVISIKTMLDFYGRLLKEDASDNGKN